MLSAIDAFNAYESLLVFGQFIREGGRSVIEVIQQACVHQKQIKMWR